MREAQWQREEQARINLLKDVYASREKDILLKQAKKKEAEVPAENNNIVVEKRNLGAASINDILGLAAGGDASLSESEKNEKSVPKKWLKNYRSLIELRDHFTDELELHTSETLKRSSREDSGDLSGYGQHQADAGTDTFDRDLALSMVSNEQDALYEIDQAIKRILNGTYGVCEITEKPINKARLNAVPFTRFSVEGQAQWERMNRRKVERGGVFGDGEDGPTLAASADDEED
jgi:RNA polymerase-binding transcription factor DksA